MRCHLIIIKDGRRLTKIYDDCRQATKVARALRSKGLRCRVATVGVLTYQRYPPEEDDLSSRNLGKLWCPYCRDWSYFKVPKFHAAAEVGSDEWFMNSYHRQGIAACAWCHISEMDFYVRQVNDTWAVIGKRRTRRKRRVRVASR